MGDLEVAGEEVGRLVNKLLKLAYPALFIFSSIVFLGHYAIAGQAVYGDGIGYFAHLHSWVIDGDWDNTNEYKHVYSPDNNNTDEPKVSSVVQIVPTSKEGKAVNHFGPGMAFLLLPFYVFANLIANIGNTVGINFHANGYSDLYQIFSGLGAIVYVMFGLFILEKLVNTFIKTPLVSRISVFTLFLSSNLFYYGSYNVINSHFASFFLATSFFYVLYKFKDAPSKHFLLGLIGGLMAANRPQDGFIVVVWLISVFFKQRFSLDFKKLKKMAESSFVFALGFFATLSLSIVHLLKNYGTVSNRAYMQSFANQLNDWRSIDFTESLLNPTTGLFAKSPILIVVFVYFVYLAYKKRANALYFLAFVFFLGQLLIITAQGGWVAAAYGGRMYISSFVFFGLILGEFIKSFTERFGMKLVLLFISGFTILNFYSILRFTLYEKEASGGNVGIEEYTLERFNNLQEKFNKLY